MMSAGSTSLLIRPAVSSSRETSARTGRRSISLMLTVPASISLAASALRYVSWQPLRIRSRASKCSGSCAWASMNRPITSSLVVGNAPDEPMAASAARYRGTCSTSRRPGMRRAFVRRSDPLAPSRPKRMASCFGRVSGTRKYVNAARNGAGDKGLVAISTALPGYSRMNLSSSVGADARSSPVISFQPSQIEPTSNE